MANLSFTNFPPDPLKGIVTITVTCSPPATQVQLFVDGNSNQPPDITPPWSFQLDTTKILPDGLHTIRADCLVKGATQSISRNVTITNAGSVAPPTVDISGTAAQGNTLTANVLPTGSYTYKWRRCDSSGTPIGDIAGATASTYLVAPADVGYTLRVVVTYATGAVTSAQTAVVTSIAPPTVTISGTPQVGQTLSASGAFPTTPLLDTFDRANENPLSQSGQWLGPIYPGDVALQVISNQAGTNVTTRAQSYRSAAAVSAPLEIYGTLPTTSGSRALQYCVQNPGTTSVHYYLLWMPTATSLRLIRADSSTLFTQVYEVTLPSSATWGAGDSLGVRLDVNGTHNFYRKPSAGSWGLVGSCVDSTYKTGFIGLSIEGSTAGTWDSFGGGGSRTYQWQDTTTGTYANVSGATAQTKVITANELGYLIRVAAYDPITSLTGYSQPVFVTLKAVSISGTPTQGQTLTAVVT